MELLEHVGVAKRREIKLNGEIEQTSVRNVTKTYRISGESFCQNAFASIAQIDPQEICRHVSSVRTSNFFTLI